MGDIKEPKCPKALLQHKVLWCTVLNNFCANQRHCNVKGHAVLTEQSARCRYRETN